MMAITTVTFDNKENLNTDPDIPRINKVTDDDINQLKNVTNINANLLGDLDDLNTTDKDSIVDSINEIVDKSEYSSEEKIVGIWVDGKPVYRRTIVLTDTQYYALQSSYDITSFNIDTVVKLDSIFSYTSNEKYHRNPYYISSTDFCQVFERNGYIQMRLGSLNGTFNYFIHTLEYTKTTDTNEKFYLAFESLLGN